tara:strand:- start:2250 stop:2687 length:438 start_codon:yes stop_codon:yes gene_type:complete
MAHIAYVEDIKAVTDIFFDSQERLINNICSHLGCPEKKDELVKKFLDSSIKIKKPKKDPEEPKKAKTSYMFYCDEFRVEVVSSNPGIKLGSVSKKLGEGWGKLSEEQKKKYTQLSEEDKTRYEQEREDYNNKLYLNDVLQYQNES